jgi:hypothetical protein
MSSTDPVAFLNGGFSSASMARISAGDRGFLYGDGLFESICVHDARPFLWEWHMMRFTDGAVSLGITLPQTTDSLLGNVHELIRRNDGPECIVRIALSRGVGERGYGVTGEEQPTLLITQHPLPPKPGKPLSLVSTSARVAVDDPLAKLKSANKLGSILAKREATAQGVIGESVLGGGRDASHAAGVGCCFAWDHSAAGDRLGLHAWPSGARRIGCLRPPSTGRSCVRDLCGDWDCRGWPSGRRGARRASSRLPIAGRLRCGVGTARYSR